ncbi:MAG: cupin domain-containing protein [Candidatus Sulfopaludibacter sp.]|nr:cupin domain-containing protein [Candidatus Sulfopaludibacter sp.]
MKPFLLLLLAAGFAFPAGDPTGFYIWKSAELKALPTTLAAKLAGANMTSQPAANLGNYTFATVLRKESGGAELHETQADIFVITAGEGTLTVGGTIPDGKTTQPHEIRGTAITGGIDKKVGPGDVLTIPAKMPHRMKVERGKQIAYLAIKVTQ